jgi:hypothetical protein
MLISGQRLVKNSSKATGCPPQNGPLCQRLAGRLIYSQLTVFLMDSGCESGGMCRGTLLGGGCGGTPQRRAGC